MNQDQINKFGDEKLTMSILLKPDNYRDLVQRRRELILDRSLHWEYLDKFIPTGPIPLDLFGEPVEIYPGLIGLCKITVTYSGHTQTYLWGIKKVIKGTDYWYVLLKSEIKTRWT